MKKLLLCVFLVMPFQFCFADTAGSYDQVVLDWQTKKNYSPTKGQMIADALATRIKRAWGNNDYQYVGHYIPETKTIEVKVTSVTA